MKLLFDENPSFRLCASLADVFPGAQQVDRAALGRATDDAICSQARREGFAIVTLDSDFADIAALRGGSPKVIWLRCGNRTTAFVELLLRANASVISNFLEDADAACLELY